MMGHKLLLLLILLVLLSVVFYNRDLFEEKFSFYDSYKTYKSGWLRTDASFKRLKYLQSIYSQDFQKIGNGQDKLYVYSAYASKHGIVGQEESSIVILAGLKTNYSNSLYCRLYDDYYHIIELNQAVLKALEYDNLFWKRPYQPYYIICSATNITETRPSFVSVIESKEKLENVSNLLPITYNNNQKFNFTLCVQPFFNFEDPFMILEWMEYYILMGIQKFTFYNISLGPKTMCVLKSYKDLVEILPFSNPYIFHEEIILGAQFLASNECLQRYRGITKYLVIVDVDEMIVPSSPSIGNNFYEMMNSLNKYLTETNHSIDQISGYKFVNGFFFSDWETVTNLSSGENLHKIPIAIKMVLDQMKMSMKLLREKDFITWRTKYIVVPDLAIELGSHVIVESVGNSKEVLIPENLAYLHHYRNCKHSAGFSENCTAKERVIDSTALRFTEKIASKVTERFLAIAKSCNLDKE